METLLDESAGYKTPQQAYDVGYKKGQGFNKQDQHPSRWSKEAIAKESKTVKKTIMRRLDKAFYEGAKGQKQYKDIMDDVLSLWYYTGLMDAAP